MQDVRIQSFAPLAASDAALLILGTMPSVKSLKDGFYYAHTRNAFWPILSDVFGMNISTVSEKQILVETHALALWDVAESCVREGSLDSSMRSIVPNDIPALVQKLPIKRILLNGQTAFRLFHRYFPALAAEKRCLLLPSTSPAYTLPYEKKLAAWRQALNEPFLYAGHSNVRR